MTVEGSSYQIQMSEQMEVVGDACVCGGRCEVKPGVDDVKPSQFGQREVKSDVSDMESN